MAELLAKERQKTKSLRDRVLGYDAATLEVRRDCV